MPQIHLQSAAEQVATHLREEVLAGLRSGLMPGANRLAAELGVNHKTVEAALCLLEKEGILMNQGAGRCRSIEVPRDGQARKALRVALLLLEQAAQGADYMVKVRHLLEEAGHVPFYADKTLLELGMDPSRVAQLVEARKADAWVVCAGSREVLQWFSQRGIPAFALFGRRHGLTIAGAGPDKSPSLVAATRHLIELGHRRISLLVRSHHRLPEPHPTVNAFLGELVSHGIEVGEFNLPNWEESKAGFQEILRSLFHLTPPTAIFTDEAFLFTAAQQFAAGRGIGVPGDVSLICTDDDPTFIWCEPSVAHISWDYEPVVRRIARWATDLSLGKEDLGQTLTRAEFVNGGTIGPPPAW